MNSPRDVLVIGAGPAGLAAAKACIDLGLDIEVVEQGKELSARSKDDPNDAITGIGGAGLYSDGKFSFYPSASRLWQLQPYEDLLHSYNWLSALLRLGGLEAEPIPRVNTSVPPSQSEFFERKHYPSYYMPFPQRLAIIENLARDIPVQPLTRLVRATLDESSQFVSVNLSGPDGDHRLLCRAIIFAGGRFGPLLLPNLFFGESQIFRRIEVGVRIEQDSQSFFLQSEQGIDPKFIAVDREVPCEWRTFCCCRDGLVVSSIHEGLLCLSGRADCPPTGKSNVGFNVRVTDEDLAHSIWPEALSGIAQLRGPIVQPLNEIIGEELTLAQSALYRSLGSVAPLLSKGLRLLVNQFPGLLNGALIYAPTLEGVGHYPKVDDHLRVETYPAWVAGDASGIFRGLTAALVSGYHAGLQASRYLRMAQ